VPDTSPARHSRNGCAYKITRPFPAKSLYPTTPILPYQAEGHNLFVTFL